MPPELDAETRRDLKRQAHHLNVIVTAGAAGLTAAVMAEIDQALTDHELVKLRLAADDRAGRRQMVDHICNELEASCVQRIGHTATVYRPRPVGE